MCVSGLGRVFGCDRKGSKHVIIGPRQVIGDGGREAAVGKPTAEEFRQLMIIGTSDWVKLYICKHEIPGE